MPTIILLFAGLVGSIVFIEDMSAIAIISAATSSKSMALIGILNTMTGHKDKEDPITSLMREQSQVTRELIEYIKNDKAKSQSIRLGDKEVSLTEGSTNIHVSEDDIHRQEVEIQTLTDSHVASLNQMQENKEKELLDN